MTRLLAILICILLSTPALAQERCLQSEDCYPQTARLMVVGGGVPVAEGGCAAPLVFQWSMEDWDVTANTPAGCTDNATTTVTESGDGALSTTAGALQDGTYSLKLIYDADYCTIPITMGNNGEEGTIDVYMYFATGWGNWVPYITISYDADNKIILQTNGTDKIGIAYGAGGVYDEVYSSASLSATTKYRVIAKWKRGAATTLSIQLEGDAAQTSAAELGALAGVPTTLRWDTDGADVHTDLIKVYNTWQ